MVLFAGGECAEVAIDDVLFSVLVDVSRDFHIIFCVWFQVV